MNNSKATIVSLLLLLPLITISQQFWLLSNEFWDGPKTGITLINDSILVVGTSTGVLKSTDEGYHFEKVLSASAVHTVFASSAGHLYAGGNGKIFYSEDSGISWDSVALNSAYPVNQIIELKKDTLFATTLDYNQGDGVFYSQDNGRTWEPRNQGLGSLLGCEKIAADKNGRLYLLVSDKESTGKGGLFISENKGLLWEKVQINIDSIYGPIKITDPTGLSISPHDSLYLSFYGVATNYMVQLNICKNLEDVPLENSWKVFHVNTSSNWWEDRPINNIYFSQNGDWYSSYTETLNHGATYFLKAGDKNWQRIDYGLGSAEDGWRHEQIFAEKKSGRIYMVQYLDERIYTTDNSLLTDVNAPVKYPEPIILYPNPVKAGGKVTVQIPKTSGSVELAIYDLTGRNIQQNNSGNHFIDLTAPQKAGIYILTIREGDKIHIEKIHVN